MEKDAWLQLFLSCLTDLGLEQSGDQRSRLLTREERGVGGEDKRYQGNGDIVLNILVTVIEECLCVGMSCPNMCLCM